ncbi:hypothetical protein OESDEN_02470 [Oesophagostomum dentatum]|uniref:Uncharacterized protein n=1 Tax=Oesophagostomum dentatum TaxID=61180 RepID=A0A0B1TP10_OESDE|nr:hypothetical protein OESDEN_02470 [Oesophagostomum dentatum]
MLPSKVTPHMIFLTYSWNPKEMDLNPYVTMFSGMPMLIQLRINLSLTVAVAVERSLAIFLPLIYRKLSSARFATFALIVACSFAVFDLFIGYWTSPIQRKPNCAAVGCFMSKRFTLYWGVNNVVDYELPRDNPDLNNRNEITGNRRSLGILLTSILCITIPTATTGILQKNGTSLFANLGPFYIVLLLCSGNSFMPSNVKMQDYESLLGTCNSIAVMFTNWELREGAIKICNKGKVGVSVRSTGTAVPATSYYH